MTKYFFLFTLLVSFFYSPSWSKDLTTDDLVYRDSLWYKKFSDVPFKGKVSGISVGKFNSGKKVGFWLVFHENGQLSSKGNYKDGYKDGQWVEYFKSGQLSSKGNYKDGKKDGQWEYWTPSGDLSSKGNYRDGMEDGQWERNNRNYELTEDDIYIEDFGVPFKN